jgi:hypothetical protein
MRTRLFSLLAALAAAPSVSAVTSGKAAAATGSYTITNLTAPTLYNEDEFINGSTTSTAPAGVPSTATVTSVTALFDWIPKPNPPGYYSSSTNYGVFLCEDAADTMCANVGPTCQRAERLDDNDESVQWAERLDAELSRRRRPVRQRGNRSLHQVRHEPGPTRRQPADHGELLHLLIRRLGAPGGVWSAET